MKLVTVHFPIKIIESMDKLLLDGLIPNRSELIRTGVLMLLENLGYMPKEVK